MTIHHVGEAPAFSPLAAARDTTPLLNSQR